MRKELAIIIPAYLNEILLSHLIRQDGQEDLCFALYVPVEGNARESAIITEIILPELGDHQVHGNVSFNEQFFKRACSKAMEKDCGVSFMHSHPYTGWQSMSDDDIAAETNMAPTAFTLTDRNLVGMTLGSDGTWSARIWNHLGNGRFEKSWCALVKSVGKVLKVNFNDDLLPIPMYREQFKRTQTVYGKQNHQQVSRLRVGIVGIGSVGSILVETLARMGLQSFVLIDFDIIKEHNLDRQLGATLEDIGEYKVTIAERLIRRSATCQNLDIRTVKYSIAKREAYEASLDCDVIFSCVDRPLPRYILNHIAYAHLIPVIDGGIKVKFENGKFTNAEWQLQTATPGNICLQCLGVYEPSEVDMERMGKLDDPTYLEGLPKDHHLKTNENIFPFSANLASMEVFQFISITTEIGDVHFGVQRFRYAHSFISNYLERHCDEHCAFLRSIGTGDSQFTPVTN